MDRPPGLQCRNVVVILLAGEVHRFNQAECWWGGIGFEVALPNGAHALWPWQHIREVAYEPLQEGA